LALIRPELVVSPDAESASIALADRVEQSAERAIADRGEFRIALSGGSTPRRLYELLAERAERIDWEHWRVFFGDERAVPPDDLRSNFRMAREALLSKVALPEFAVHRIRGELPAARAAELYESELGEAPLDFVLLGMGGDGHTASLFPGDSALDETEHRVVPATAPVEPKQRITLTLRALCEAREAAFLVIGADKNARVAEVLAALESDATTPVAARVRPRQKLWFHLDPDAASALPG
jgi:6-phosphogluconolactonase